MPTHERVVAEVYISGKFVVQVSEERGPGLFDIETPDGQQDESQVLRCVEASDLIAGVQAAIGRLRDLDQAKNRI